MMITAALLLLLLPASQIRAVPPPEPPPPLDLGVRDERMTLPVTIAGAGPFAFIVDTSAQRSVISRELAAELGLPKGRMVRIVAMTGAASVPTAVVPRITVGSLGAADIEAPMLAARHIGAAGLLGLDMLHDRRLRIDYATNTMTVDASRAGQRRPHPLSGEIVVTARCVVGQLVVTEASYHGLPVRVMLDTGLAVSIATSRCNAGPVKVNKDRWNS